MNAEQQANHSIIVDTLTKEGWVDIRSEGAQSIFFYGKRSKGSEEKLLVTMIQDGRWSQLVIR